MPISDLKLVAGLDLARRRDHSALVLLDVEPDRLTVSAALRLPQAPLRQQFALDRTAPRRPRPPGLRSERPRRRRRGTAAENTAACRRLPRSAAIARSPARRHGDRLVVGKSWLIQRLGTAMRSGALTVAERAPGRDLLRDELAQFVFKPGERGRLRLEAARGHDDLVIAAALAVLASDLVKVGTACLKEPARTPL